MPLYNSNLQLVCNIGNTTTTNIKCANLGLADSSPSSTIVLAMDSTGSTISGGLSSTINHTGPTVTMRAMLFEAQHAGSSGTQTAVGGGFTSTLMTKNAGTATMVGVQGTAKLDAAVSHTANTTNLYNKFEVLDDGATISGGTINARSLWAANPPSFTGATTIRALAFLCSGDMQVNNNKKLYLGGQDLTISSTYFIRNSSTADLDLYVDSVQVANFDDDRIAIKNVPLQLEAIAAPTPVVGDMWYDSTKKHYRDNHDIAEVGRGGRAYSSVADSSAIANTTTTTDFDVYFTIPANTLTVGTSYRLKAFGHYTTSGTPGTFALSIVMGSTLVTNTLTPTKNVTKNGWTIDALLTVRSIGAAGTIVVGAFASMDDGITKNTAAVSSTSTPAVIDTTASIDLKIALKMSVASATNAMTLVQYYFGIN